MGCHSTGDGQDRIRKRVVIAPQEEEILVGFIGETIMFAVTILINVGHLLILYCANHVPCKRHNLTFTTPAHFTLF